MKILFAALLMTFLPLYVECQVYGASIHNSKFECHGKADGLAEIGCDGMLQCVNGEEVKTYCNDNQYFDRNTMTCIDALNNQTGCTSFNICAHMQDGSYPDPENNCQSYYTCHRHQFYGHQYCPGGLVFSSTLQLCDWPHHVLFPCGTLSLTTTVVVG